MADSLVSQSSILINSPSRALLSYSPYSYPYPAGVSLRLRYTPNSSISTRFANRVSRCFIKEIEDLNNGIGEFKSAIDGQACASGTVSVVDWADQEEAMEPIAQESIFGDTILTELLVQSEEEQNHFRVFQVQSEEEQDAMAATPAHPAGLYALYASFFAGNLVEQIWSFAWPAAVALLHPSLLPVAVVGFVTKLGIFVGGPLVGQFMDSFPRVLAFNLLSTVQTAAQLLSASMIIYALNKHSHTTAASVSASALLVQPWFVILVIAGAIERLTGLATGVAFERDWVVLLAGINRPIALARANAMLSRVDLLCEIAGASIFGILLSKFGPVRSLKLAGAMMMCTLPILIFSVCLTDRLSKHILERPKCHVTHNESSINTSGTDPANLVKRGVDAIWCGWLQYKTQPVLPVSLACMLLYFNAVLAPGGLMTAYLTQRGLNPSIIGGFSGLCAFTGVAATFISASLVKKLGLLKAGAAGLVFQALPLGVAVVVYWSGLLTQQKSLLFFLFLIVLSRLGHMSYDIVGGQILQTAIPPSQANLIGTIEVSMASLAELLMLGIAIIANDVSHFGFLASLSLVAVSGAAFIYCRWLLRVKGSKPIDSHIPYNSDFVGKELARNTTN